MKFKMLASIVIAGVALAGCDNNQTASESNFKKSIQDYLDTKPAICINTGSFPAGFLAPSNTRTIEQLDTLVDAGLLNKANKQIVVKDMWGTEKSGDGVEFTLTSEGQKFFDATKADFSGRGSFCTGKFVVTEVTNFTEPAERGGQKVSIANFKQKIEDVAPWAKNEKVIAAYPQIKTSQERAEKSQQSPLVLTNNGWIHIALFNQK
ncbi:hypothetical protein REJ26_001552 [Providencia stuartii]|uniref:Lipoprotein n=2 Tax=Providencia TaxID=586 RepID=A0AAI9GJI0_PROST|nr:MULTISPECIES: hypothetical protein [Providencia]MDV5227607.1 hypothetical protein [Providencia rettgeri]ELR5113561.1 hypothetical protein [Providencia stuartii]ELR5299799.1 hypothetical protein [Providencia stuartii]MDW7588872.1 hypothetical protein [Providencia sp. 2023EL-00965]MDX4945624.1 hypothetical protein [Providencia manganoxydans]